jgi:hypothetical protein
MKGMITDTMLELAFRFRDKELWRWLDDSDLFAFRLTDGQIVYCCVMGNAGSHHSLGCYIGGKGFTTYLNTLKLPKVSRLNGMALVTAFDCINIDFVQAADLQKEERSRVKEYAREHGIAIRRSYGWPDFSRFSSGRPPRTIDNVADAGYAEEALRAALAVAESLEKQDMAELGFMHGGRYATERGGKLIPMLTPDGHGGYDWGMTKTPPAEEEDYPAPAFTSQTLICSVAALPPDGMCQCRAFRVSLPAVDSADDPLFYPMVMLIVEENGMLLPVTLTEHANEDASQMVVSLAEFLLHVLNKRPRSIAVTDMRTFNLLRDFCQRAGIMLVKVKVLKEMDYAVTSFCHQMGCF